MWLIHHILTLKRTLILVYFLLVCNPTFGQIKFDIFDKELGYCSHSFHIIQDDFGFLWSGTLTGLIKTDGYQYTKFTNDGVDSTTIATNFSSYLFEDRYSNIWVNSHLFGLSIYDRSKDHFVRIPVDTDQNLQLGSITSFYEANDSTIYLSGDKGLQRVILNKEEYGSLRFDHFELPDQLKLWNKHESHIWHINALDERNLLVASVMGFFVFDINKQKFLNANDDERLPEGVGFSTWCDTVRNEIWFAEVRKPLTVLDMKTNRKRTVDGLPINGGETYFFQLDSATLLLKENGFDLKVIDLNTYSSTSYEAGPDSEINLKDRWSRRFCKTLDGSVFLASSDESRFQHIPSVSRQIEHIQVLDSKNNHTSSVYEDDNYFISTFDNNGLFVRNKRTGKESHYTASNSGIKDNLLMKIMRLRDGKFLVLGKPYAYTFDPSSEEFKIISTALFFRNAIELNNGELWLFPGGGAPLHSFEFKNGRYIRKDIPKDLSEVPNIRAAIEDNKGNIWMVSSVKGLLKLNSEYEVLGHWMSNQDGSSPVGNSMESLYQDSKGRIWIGSLEGLSLYIENKKLFTSFTLKDGLDDTSISDIIEDQNGQIWISSFDGLYQYDEHSKSLKRISKSKTLNQHFSQRGFFQYKDKIYAPGWAGIDIITLHSKVSNLVPPTVQMTGIYKNDKKISSANNLELLSRVSLTPEYKNAKLQFSAIHYGSADDKRLQYSINQNDTWTDLSDQRMIDMSQLDYGSHVLEIRASNADGIWSESKRYYVDLAKPWYNSWWFYILCVLGVLSVIFVAYKWRITQLKKIQKKQLEVDRQIAEIELKALKAQMNPHFVFNSLNSVKALILKQKTQDAVIYLESFSDLIRKILNNSNDKFIRLQDELDTVKLYLDLESLRFDDAFTYDVYIDDRVSTDFIEVPSLMFQPYIENAIWHGLLPKVKGEKRLNISIKRISHMIEIEIMDNGIGRAAAQIIKTRTKSKNKSLGMIINSQRIDLLRQLYGKDTSVEIVDLFNSDGRAAGTKVVMRFYAPE